MYLNIKSFKSLFLIIFSSIVFLNNCAKPKNLQYLHGQNNLLEKSEQLTTKYSNKNDIIKILGETIVKDPLDSNVWYYSEVLETSDFFGRKKIIKSNLLVLKINENGILEKKFFYKTNNLNDINFDQTKTVSLGIDNSLIKTFLKTSKKRIENQSKNLKN